MKKLFIFLAVLASLSIFRTASAQTPSPTINGTPPPFTFTGPGVSQTGQTFTFTGTGTGLGSITWSLPAYMTASPGTITTAGTQTFSFNTETANTVFAGPSSGSAAAPRKTARPTFLSSARSSRAVRTASIILAAR